MTVGYGDFTLEPFWAKVKNVSRGNSGRYHAWYPGGAACKQPGNPSRYTRERTPVRACRLCLKAVA